MFPRSAKQAKAEIRAGARHGALDVLSMAAAVSVRTHRGWQRPRVHFIYLHFVPPGSEGKFRRLIRELKRSHEIISYSQAVTRVVSGDIDRPYACFSFDDGFASCLNAASILEEEGISGCFFVCTGLVGLDRSQLERYFPGACETESRSLSWAEIEGMLERGHEIGSHTMTHPVLADHRADEIAAQVVGSRDELTRRLGKVDHFAWPKGQWKHFTPEAAQIVRDAGYLSCASAQRGAHTVGGQGQSVCIRREHIHLSWPLRHDKYFIGKSARLSTAADNGWGWTNRNSGSCLSAS